MVSNMALEPFFHPRLFGVPLLIVILPLLYKHQLLLSEMCDSRGQAARYCIIAFLIFKLTLGWLQCKKV
jgi:hypothetical protein